MTILSNFYVLPLTLLSVTLESIEIRFDSTKTNVSCLRVSDEEGLYKPVPPPKSVPNNQKNQNGQESSRVQTVVEQSSRPISAIERNVTLDDNQVRSSGQNPAPEYRMPPLYGEEQSSNQTQQAANLQTHSSKFPVSLFQADSDMYLFYYSCD